MTTRYPQTLRLFAGSSSAAFNAHSEGVLAALRGSDKATNPHPVGSQEWSYFELGHLEASYEAGMNDGSIYKRTMEHRAIAQADFDATLPVGASAYIELFKEVCDAEPERERPRTKLEEIEAYERQCERDYRKEHPQPVPPCTSIEDVLSRMLGFVSQSTPGSTPGSTLGMTVYSTLIPASWVWGSQPPKMPKPAKVKLTKPKPPPKVRDPRVPVKAQRTSCPTHRVELRGGRCPRCSR